MYIHSEELSDLQYVTDRVRVKAKAIGTLTTQEPTTSTPAPQTQPDKHTDLSTVDPREVWL